MPERKEIIFFYLTLNIILTIINTIPAWAQNASPRMCADFKLPVSTDGRVDRTAPVIVIRDETPVYETPDASSTVMQLSFNTKLRISRIEGGSTRIQVRNTGSEKPLGWVEGADLLCALHAMKSAETGLETIFFVKTNIEIQNEREEAVKAFPWPDRNDCPDGGCRELIRFQRLFVFDYDKDNKRYLLANYSSLKSSESFELYGWVNETAGFIWDTAYGLRPREDLVFPEGHKMAGEPMTVPVYKTLEDAKAGQNAYPVLGGPIWYRYEMRLPLIAREGNFYKVIFSVPKTGVNQISPEKDISSINNLKKDVTMEGYIPISKDIVEDIFVKADDLATWIDLLRRIDEQASQNVSGKAQRASLVGVLKENLEHTLGHKLDNCGTMRECLSRIGGLPVKDNSPLFKYSMDQLMDIKQVPDCEINLIKTWIHNTWQMLSVINKGDKKPRYHAIPFPGDCPSGSHIPYIDGDIDDVLLCPTLDCSWRYPVQKTFYYWVPKEYMP